MSVASHTDPNVKRLISQPTDQKQIGEMMLKISANIRRMLASNFMVICILWFHLRKNLFSFWFQNIVGIHGIIQISLPILIQHITRCVRINYWCPEIIE